MSLCTRLRELSQELGNFGPPAGRTTALWKANTTHY